jgi:multicomponent Na+:H+ antiporter subunit B
MTGVEPVIAQVTAIEASLLVFVVLTAIVTALARDVLAAADRDPDEAKAENFG